MGGGGGAPRRTKGARGGGRGHGGRVGGPGGVEGPGGAFGSTIAKQAPQEGTATPSAAPTRAPAAATAGEGAPVGHRPPCGVVKLPRPTPHPRSGAQDGAVRPVIFCSVAARDHSWHRVALVRPRAANYGALGAGEEEEPSVAMTSCLNKSS